MHIDPDDICLWADGTFCSRSELNEFSHMSDDYEVLSYGTSQWDSFTQAADALSPEELKAWHQENQQ